MTVAAHLCATFLAAVIITTGTEMIALGPVGLLSGLGKSLGGFLIWLILGVISLPLGIALRWAMGKLHVNPLPMAVACGVVIGWILIPILNPAMRPGLSLSTNPLGLLVVYALAGGLGGLAWWAVEFGNGRRHHA